MGEEKIQKKTRKITEVPLLIVVWIKADHTSIDHHQSRRQKTTKETLEHEL